MLRAATFALVFVLMNWIDFAAAAVFSFETRIISPPVTSAPTNTGGEFTGHLFLSDNNDYIFEFLSFSSPTKEQGNSIRIASEGSDYWDTGRTLTQADDDTISMVDFDFEVDIVDEPTGKTFPFAMSGDLSGSVTFFDSNGEPFFGCTSNCYEGDYSSSLGFNSASTGGSMTMGNVVYELSPYRQVINTGASSTGVESFLGFEVERTELPPGDFDHDGAVTGLDYGAWIGAFNQTGMGLWADANCDGVVDAADYTVWRDNLSSSASIPDSAGSAEVPEPVTAGLITICLLTLSLAGSGRALR